MYLLLDVRVYSFPIAINNQVANNILLFTYLIINE